MQEFTERAQPIKLVIFDVDGVMTDGSLYLSDDGQETKAFNSLDGHGMKMLMRTGVELAIITGRTSRLVEARANNLGIVRLFQGVEDKLAAYRQLLAEMQLQPAAAAYMGDDVVDLPVMRRCGLALTVPEAPALVRQYAHYVTKLGGGRGAVREACEAIMRAQQTFEAQMAQYLE